MVKSDLPDERDDVLLAVAAPVRQATAHWARWGSRRHALTAAGAVLATGYLTLTTVLLLSGWALLHLGHGVTRWDEHANVWIAARRIPTLDAVSHWGTFLANTLGVVAVAVVVVGVLCVRRWGRLAAMVPAGLALELVTFLTVNYGVRRPRPSVPHLGSTPTTFSFPSGHVAATVVLYAGIAVLVAAATRRLLPRLVAWTAAVAFPTWVAFSRVYEGQHHVFDVLAGMVMGIGALAVAICAARVAIAEDGR